MGWKGVGFMKKNRGFYLLNILISISIVFLIFTISYVCLRNYIERQEINRAKTEIYELFTTYATKTFHDRREKTIKLDYLKKEITVFEFNVVPIEKLLLPKRLNYVTIFDKDPVKIFTGKITKNGNITPSFSIYIFDYNNIAQYRISLYGFDIIKYMRINIYKNKRDKTPKYDNILKFHNSWTTDNPKWEEEW